MIKEKIETYFNQYSHLKVLFFFDKKKEYLEEVHALELDDVHIEYWNNNPFSLKCKLIDELRDSKVFLYLPMASPNNQEAYHNFPLMGLLLANKELQLDNLGEFMETFRLQRHQKALVSRYIQELKYSGVQEVCKPILSAANFNEPALQKGLLSSFLKFKSITSWSLITAKLLTLAVKKDQTELNRTISKVNSLNFEEEVINKIKQITGFTIQKLSKDNLLEVCKSILYNKLTQTIPTASSTDPYKAFKLSDPAQLTQLNQMLFEVERQPSLNENFNDLLMKVGKYIKGEKLIEIYGEDADFAEFNTAMIWQVIENLQGHIKEAPKDSIKKLERISLQQDLDESVITVLKFFINVSKLFDFIKGIESYILNNPEDYIHEYTEQLYKIDTTYRKVVSGYKQLDLPEIPKTIDVDAIQSEINTSYEAHIDKLNREWLKCLNQFNFDYSKLNVPKQYDFYKTEIESLDQKVVVIISDALRYEVAQELLSEMHGDAKNTAEIRFMLASIPSKTNIGMAQLLPYNTIIFNNGDIKINDTLTAGINNRNKILEGHNSEAYAIQYSDLSGLNQSEKREIFKKPVVYIYHDVIDSIGDKKPSERRTTEAVEDAIDEIKLLTKNLHATNNVAKVYITADHGFLYNDREIQEKEKEALPNLEMIQSHNRYFLTNEVSDEDLSYCMPLNATTVFNDQLFVTIPFSVNRYKKQGVGHQFVHGGGSLQELVVPLIESSRKRVEVAKKVTPILIHKGILKVVSNILRLNILQENEVSRMEKERTLSIGLYKENELVSNEVALILNSTSESPSERMSKAELTLASVASDSTWLKLKIFDAEDMLNPLIEERVQNNTIIPTDF